MNFKLAMIVLLCGFCLGYIACLFQTAAQKAKKEKVTYVAHY